ncbi:MAG TPA: response regulator [Candidatus Saccharimonadales bacterium]|nr:response regulator [Candidatus Saccharimonadales bacterium]
MANILVVEDDKDLNQAYKIILAKEGHTVEAAFNGEEALEKLQNFQPQLILLDLLMPIMGGLEFLEQYDLPHTNPKVKVLIFTNMETSADVTKAYDLGAYRCIIKSWTAPQNLARVVDDALAGRLPAAKT